MSKIYTIVQNLNEELYENTKKDNVWYSYTLDNYVDSVAFNFFGENNNIKIDLWNSENSQQVYSEKTDDYEPLEITIKRELREALKNLTEVIYGEDESI